MIDYLRVVFRHIYRGIGPNILNVAGLTIGLAVSLILGVYVSNEYNYDSFHKKKERIFQFWATVKFGGITSKNMYFSAGTASGLKEKYPGIEAFCRVKELGNIHLSTEQRRYSDKDGIFADPNFFRIFDFPVIRGSSKSLSAPNTVVITETISKKYFGDENPIGKTLALDDSIKLEVIGLCQDVPARSSIRFSFVCSMETLRNIKKERQAFQDNLFGFGTFRVYFLMNPISNVFELAAQIPLAKEPFEITNYHFESLKGMHVRNYGGDEQGFNYTLIFALAGTLTFVLTLINYINFITTQSLKRAGEMVIRKINGASRLSILFQFSSESFLLTSFSFALAMVVTWALLPTVSQLINLGFERGYFLDFDFIKQVAIIFIFFEILICVWPVIFTFKTNVTSVLGSRINHSKFITRTRTVLIIFQFSISTGLILSSQIIQRQLHFLSTKNLGLNPKQIIAFSLDRTAAKKYSVLKAKALRVNGVTGVAASTISLFKYGPMIVLAQRSDSLKDIPLSLMTVDSSFATTLELTSKQNSSLRDGIVLNETAVSSFSLGSGAIGAKINIAGRMTTVIGVVKDFNYASLREKIENVGVQVIDDPSPLFGFTGCVVYAKVSTSGSIAPKIRALEKIYKEISPETPFGYFFLDEAFNNTYKNETSLLAVFELFTIGSMTVSCFGLISLLLFNIRNRMLELSIRKIVGARMIDLGWLLFKETLVIIVVSCLLVFPLIVYFFNDWLRAFAYRIQLEPVVFATTAIAVFLIAIFTTFYFIAKASRVNPVYYLREN